MPVYEEKKKVNGQKRYYIRTYITDEFGNKKQITKHNPNWIGRDGYWEAQQEENKLKKNVIATKKKKISLEELCNEYISNINLSNKESTCYDYESVIKSRIVPYLGKKQIQKITTDDIEAWKEKLNTEDLTRKYKNKCYTVFKLMMGYGKKQYHLLENVVKTVGNFKKTQAEKQEIKINEPIRYITFDQFQQLISCVNDNYWYTFFNIIYFTGLRIGELQALKWEDLNFTNKTISVSKTLTTKVKGVTWKLTSTKNLKNRIVDIDYHLLNILYNFKQERKKIDGFQENWFIFGDTEPLKENKINYNKEFYFNSANMIEITNHEFRHSHVSLLINEYIKSGQTDTTKFFVMVSKRLGHTIDVMIKTYLHLFPEVQKPIVDLIDNLQKQDQKQDQISFWQTKTLDFQGIIS